MEIKSKKFRNWLISYTNEAELGELLKELYDKRYYDWQSSKPDPVIFDVGALIGETVLYFKDQYPQAKITAFEPSPKSFQLLKKNVLQNKLLGVRLINAAVGVRDGRTDFYIDNNPDNPWGRGDTLKKTKLFHSQRPIKTRVVKLSNYLTSDVDLLKLDIEGAETEVMEEIETKLNHVRHLILEYHFSTHNEENKLSTIMTILKRNGFKTKVFLSRWRLPDLLIKPTMALLIFFNIDEYWLRVYAAVQSVSGSVE